MNFKLNKYYFMPLNILDFKQLLHSTWWKVVVSLKLMTDVIKKAVNGTNLGAWKKEWFTRSYLKNSVTLSHPVSLFMHLQCKYLFQLDEIYDSKLWCRHEWVSRPTFILVNPQEVFCKMKTTNYLNGKPQEVPQSQFAISNPLGCVILKRRRMGEKCG